MRNARSRGWAVCGWALAACGLTLAGCSPPPRTVEVIGRVTHEGKPVEGALVVFISDYRDDPPGHGVTDADGRYYLSTFFASHDMPRGAVPGRHYSIYISKVKLMDGSIVNRKMSEIASAGGDIRTYLQSGQAVRDLWPDGVPEDWPLDYTPMMRIPDRLQKDPAALEKVTRLFMGIPLLPLKYADTATSGLEATVEVASEPQVFDFNLTGEVEKVRIRLPDSLVPPAKDAPPAKEARGLDRDRFRISRLTASDSTAYPAGANSVRPPVHFLRFAKWRRG